MCFAQMNRIPANTCKLTASRLVWPLLALLLGLLTACVPAAPPSRFRIAVVTSGQARLSKLDGLRRGLADRGYVVGQNIEIALYDAARGGAQLETLLREEVARQPDMIVALGGIETQLAKAATAGSRIPVVFIGVANAVEWGVVESIRSPGAQITGIENDYLELTGKRLEWLSLLLPRARKVMLIYSSDINPSRTAYEHALLAAETLGLAVESYPANHVDDLGQLAARLRAGGADALFVLPSFMLENTFVSTILPAARQAGVPVIGFNQGMVEQGAFMAYGASFQDLGYQAARLVEKILRGVPAGHIPVEFPDTPKLSVDLVVARQLGLDVASAAVELADSVIRDAGTAAATPTALPADRQPGGSSNAQP